MPMPAPPPTPALTASFVEDTLRVTEGETAEITIRYSVAAQDSSVRVTVSPLEETATADDYDFPEAGFAIPPGSGTTGTAVLSLAALPDRLFAEGEETLILRLEGPNGVTAQFDQGSARVRINDAAVNPCRGVTIVGEPPQVDTRFSPSELEEKTVAATVLTLEFLASSEGVTLDWTSPYSGTLPTPGGELVGLWRAMVTDWAFELEGAEVRHDMGIAWFAELEIGLAFHSNDGACLGDPVARVLSHWLRTSPITNGCAQVTAAGGARADSCVSALIGRSGFEPVTLIPFPVVGSGRHGWERGGRE